MNNKMFANKHYLIQECFGSKQRYAILQQAKIGKYECGRIAATYIVYYELLKFVTIFQRIMPSIPNSLH